MCEHLCIFIYFSCFSLAPFLLFILYYSEVFCFVIYYYIDICLFSNERQIVWIWVGSKSWEDLGGTVEDKNIKHIV